MKKSFLIAVIFSIAYFESYSQTKQESIKELFGVMKQDSIANKMFNTIIPSMFTQMSSKMPPEAKAKFDEHMKSRMQSMGVIMKRFLDEDMVGIYDKHFTQAEINDYIAFYKTSSGQKMINSMTEIQKDTMAIMMQKYIPLIIQEMKNQEASPN